MVWIKSCPYWSWPDFHSRRIAWHCLAQTYPPRRIVLYPVLSLSTWWKLPRDGCSSCQSTMPWCWNMLENILGSGTTSTPCRHYLRRQGKIMATKACRMRQGKKTVKWIYVNPFIVNGMDLGVHYWSNTILLHYITEPIGLPNSCDGCGSKLSIYHTID